MYRISRTKTPLLQYERHVRSIPHSAERYPVAAGARVVSGVPALRGGLPAEGPSGAAHLDQAAVAPAGHPPQVPARPRRPHPADQGRRQGARQPLLPQNEEDTHGRLGGYGVGDRGRG